MLTYTRTFTDKEEKVLLDSLFDITKWIDGAIDGKISSCLGRAATEYRAVLIAKGAASLPVSEKDIFDLKLADPNYKNRVQREANA